MNTLNITPENFTRINNDTNGNQRYVIHFLDALTEQEYNNLENINERYIKALNKVKNLGGKKYHTKAYGGGIVFQSYNIQNLCNKLNSL